MKELDRTAFLERLSLLSFAAVAGCAAGTISSRPPTSGGAAQFGGTAPKAHIDADGTTTYTLSDGYTMFIGAASGGSLTAMLELNGAVVNTMTAPAATKR